MSKYENLDETRYFLFLIFFQFQYFNVLILNIYSYLFFV